MSVEELPIRGYGLPEGSMVEFEHFENSEPSEIETETLTPSLDLHVNVEHSQKRHWPRKVIAIGAGVVALVGSALFIKDHLPHFPQIGPKADHELTVGFGKINTSYAYDKSIDFGEISSKFDYKQHTSLDKFGPANCDTDIDQAVKTKAFAKIFITEAEVTTSKNSADIKVTGDISTQSFVNVEGGVPHVSPATGGLDICKGDHEIRWAERFAFGYDEKDHPKKHEDGILKNAGKIATACAIQRDGKTALDDAIRHNAATFNPDLKGMNPSKIKVEYTTDFGAFATGQVNSAIAGYYTEFEAVAEKYFSETDDHAKPVVNDKNLINCAKHQIEVTKI